MAEATRKEIPLQGRSPISVTSVGNDDKVTFSVDCPEPGGIRMVKPRQLPDLIESIRLETPYGNEVLPFKAGGPMEFTLPRQTVRTSAVVFRVMTFKAGCSIGIAKDQRFSLQLILEGGASPIAKVVAGLTSPFWKNGYNNTGIALAETASVEEVITCFFKQVTFGERHVKTHYTLDDRQVVVPGETAWSDPVFTAVLVDTDLGRKIVLVRYQPADRSWTGRVYETKAPEDP